MKMDGAIRPWSHRWPILLIGAMTAGWLDISFATVFWGLHGVAPERILQSVASGLLGRAAFSGGLGTALAGLLLHLSIAFLMVLAYDLVSLRLRWLVRSPWLAGPLYGVVLYGVMSFIVVPLSAASRSPQAISWIVGSVLAHVLLVGLPCALFVRAAQLPVALKPRPAATGGS